MSQKPQGFKNRILNDLELRGFIHSVTATDELDAALNNPCVIYCGFDCTADSLHIGSLLPLKMLKKFQDAGHIIVPVIGSATTKIGDPSGRDSARPLLTDDEIRKNAKGIEDSIGLVLNDVSCLSNEAFFDGLNVIDFMRDVGQHVSVNNMMRLDSVRTRLEGEEGMSFLEFAYSLFQARDFERIVNMFPDHHVIQIGGSDQWGNITMGLDLAKKSWGGSKIMKEPFGITTPLLTTSSGQKMGKTADGAVWLNESKMSTFDFWQFWRNIPDNDVATFLKLFSDSSIVLIAETVNQPLFADGINNTKKAFATEITALVRGHDAAFEALTAAEDMFEKKSDTNLPEHAVDRESMCINVPLATFLREEGFMKSAGEAKRMINQGGIRVNGVKIEDDGALVQEEWGDFKLSIGQKKHFRIVMG